MAEFQAIILAGGRGIRLYPLTEETPKTLLPANNKPLLWYQLQLLETSHFTEVLVLTVAALLPAIQDYVTREFDGKLHVELCQVSDNSETAEALREVADKITRDFIVLAGDLVTDAELHHVADCHRLNDASVTMVLRPEAPVRSSQIQSQSQKKKKNTPEPARRDKDLTDCIGLVEGERSEAPRVVLVSQAVHLNEHLDVARSLLQRRSHVVLHTDLYDGHCYVFAHWVLELLQEKTYIASIKADLVPHLVRRQFRGAAALPASVRIKAARKQALAASMSLSEEQYDPEDLVRCFAYVLPSNAYCERADTIPAYRAMDAEVGSRLRIKQSSAAGSN